MSPIIMLVAQMLAKHQQEQAAKKEMVMKLQADRAAQLGGNTAGIKAADFNRNLRNATYASPQEIMSIYGQFAGGDGDGGSLPDLSPNKSAYSLETPGDTQLDQPRSIQDNPEPLYSRTTSLTGNQDDDPYYLRQLRLNR
jgi:hypothetical protein